MRHPALEALLQSPIVYYPGFGSDGHPVKFFNTRHEATCFVYADYRVEEEQVRAALDNPERSYSGRFLGYHCLQRIPVTAEDLTPNGWQPHRLPSGHSWEKPLIRPYGFLELLERDDGYDDTHGAKQLSILFLGADGHAAYDALFCQRPTRVPYAVVLKDHGFGGNYSRFGGGGALEDITMRARVLPEFLLVAANTRPWAGYVPDPGTEGTRGYWAGPLCHLYQRDSKQTPSAEHATSPRG